MPALQDNIFDQAFTKFFKEREISGYDGLVDMDEYNLVEEKIQKCLRKIENDELSIDNDVREYILNKYRNTEDVKDIRSKRNRFFRYLFPTKTE